MFEDSIEIDLYKELGYSYVYHYNSYSCIYFCIHREDYISYWNGFEDKAVHGWTSGDTIEEAQIKMLQRTLNVEEDGIIGPQTIKAFRNKKK